MPAVDDVLAQVINNSVAPGATAPAHSVSNTASPSSPFEVTPGSEQVMAPEPCITVKDGVAGTTPIVVRKFVTSLVVMSVSSSNAMVMPEPVIPPLSSGFSL